MSIAQRNQKCFTVTELCKPFIWLKFCQQGKKKGLTQITNSFSHQTTVLIGRTAVWLWIVKPPLTRL